MESQNLPLKTSDANSTPFQDTFVALVARPKVPDSLYNPIEGWQTRIFGLHPGDASALIRCGLLTIDLVHLKGVIVHGTTQRTNYHALYYSWSYNRATYPITCNGSKCHVNFSLGSTLRPFASIPKTAASLGGRLLYQPSRSSGERQSGAKKATDISQSCWCASVAGRFAEAPSYC